jgi:hypothetical protein
MKYPSSPLAPFLAAVPQNSLHCLLAHSRVSRTAQTLSARASMSCALLNTLVALFSTAVVCFQELARSFAKTPGVGVARQQPRRSCDGSQPWLTELHNFGAPVNTFRINTCISVVSKRLHLPLESTLMKKTTSSPFRINTYEKRGGGGPQAAGLKTAAT